MMKQKVLVRIRIPMADKSYDVRLPMDVCVSSVMQTLISSLQSIIDNNLPLSVRPVLWAKKIGMPLSGEKTLREQRVVDSDELYLI